MVIGIDLGTTYSAVSYLDKKGNPQIILNREEEPMTPSVVFVDGKDVTVGKNARKKALQWPKKICRCVKRFMGFRESVLEEKEESYSPEAISAMIIRRLLEDVIMRLGESIEGIVVTVPTYFNDAKRTATKQAVQAALEAIHKESEEVAEKVKNISFIGMIDEPKAAALYYCHRTQRESGTILIYDLGGGTFDAALLEVDKQTVKMIAEGEEHEAGGAYFDDKIRDYVIAEVQNRYGINLKEESYQSERELILLDAEICKKRLSEEGTEEAVIAVSCGHRTMDVVLTKDTFEELIDTMVHRTENTIWNMLEEKGMEPEDVDEVVLVGGSSKIPYVREMLKEMFPNQLSEAVDPDKAVCYGASIYADLLLKEEKEQDKPTKTQKPALKLEDVCAHSIGLLTMEPESKEKRNDILIEENTPIIAEAERTYETAFERQTYIKLELTESEEVISEQYVKLPKDLPKGTEVKVRIRVNRSHFIEVYLEVPSICFLKEYEITRTQNLTEEEQKELSGLVASKILY